MNRAENLKDNPVILFFNVYVDIKTGSSRDKIHIIRKQFKKAVIENRLRK